MGFHRSIAIFTAVVLGACTCLNAQGVAVNSDGSTADPSAQLDVKSNSKGMLVPRMTSAQRTAISNPANGLLVFDSDTESFWYFANAQWIELVSNSNSSWTKNGTNIFNSNSGKVDIGGSSPASFRLNVTGNTSAVASFNAPLNPYLGIYENNQYRGYLGSFSGASGDMDFGTGSGNSSGKVHLTLQAVPGLTLDNNGYVGIGTTTPSERLTLNSGNILLSNSSLGVRLNAANSPLITRGFDPFTSGTYTGIGRWGLFMEPHHLVFGIPQISGKAFEFAAWLDNGARIPYITIEQGGEMNRPLTGTADLLPAGFASVSYSGVIYSGTTNIIITKVGVGNYRVQLSNDSNYNTLDYTTVASCSGGAATVFASGTSVIVRTLNASGTATDSDFHILIFKQ